MKRQEWNYILLFYFETRHTGCPHYGETHPELVMKEYPAVLGIKKAQITRQKTK